MTRTVQFLCLLTATINLLTVMYVNVVLSDLLLPFWRTIVTALAMVLVLWPAGRVWHTTRIPVQRRVRLSAKGK